MAATLVQDLTPGTEVSGVVHACEKCGQLFIARRDALYCSTACRVAAKREADKASE